LLFYVISENVIFRKVSSFLSPIQANNDYYLHKCTDLTNSFDNTTNEADPQYNVLGGYTADFSLYQIPS